MGSSGSAAEQSPEEVRRLVAAAAVQHRPIAARYDGTRRLLCPACGRLQPAGRLASVLLAVRGRNQGRTAAERR
jgi:hypothetical protein